MEVNPGIPRGVAVGQYIKALQSAFSELRKILIDKTTYFNPADDAKWKPAAELLLDNQGDPHAYVRYVFDVLVRFKGDVFVNMVTSIPRVQEFLGKRTERLEDLKQRVGLQAEAIKCRITNGWTLDDIFEDPTIGLSPVVRFALAWSEGRGDLAEPWRERARENIRFEPAYREILKTWLPEVV